MRHVATTKLDPISILYRETDQLIYERNFDEMVVCECGCRYSLVDRAISRTFFCNPLHMLQYSGITWPKVYIEQFLNTHHPQNKSRRAERMQGVAK